MPAMTAPSTLTPEQQTMPRSYVIGDRSLIINFPDGRRILPGGLCACSVCDKVVTTAEGELIRPGVRQMVARIHGPLASRCPGSRRSPQGFVRASRLPIWGDMSDHDKGQALGFVHKCWWEQSYQYARENYPPRYIGVGLADLIETYQCRHAMAVVHTLGEPLPSVENFWARNAVRLPFGPRVPSHVVEPATQMARRILGEAEHDRLIALWSAS